MSTCLVDAKDLANDIYYDNLDGNGELSTDMANMVLWYINKEYDDFLEEIRDRIDIEYIAEEVAYELMNMAGLDESEDYDEEDDSDDYEE